MNPLAFHEFAQSNQWGTLWPELSLAFLAVLVLVLDLFAPATRRRIIPALAIFGPLLVLAVLCGKWADCPLTGSGVFFGGMIEFSLFGQYMRAFFLLAASLVGYLGTVYLTNRDLPRSEFYFVVLVVSAGMMLLGISHHFVSLFVALELVTVGFYVLVAYSRTEVPSLEGGLKYLILGAASSAILLFGIVLLYAASGNPLLAGAATDGMNFSQLGAFLTSHPQDTLARVGAVLVIAGIAFKIGAVPFQIWVPDVYQGAPTPVTAFLAVASKAAGFAILVNLLRGPFAPLADFLFPLLAAMAAATILFGNLAALGQTKLKRLMGLSGIAHAGYLLVGVVALNQGVDWALWAIYFYLITYLLGSFTVFAVMVHASRNVNDAMQDLADYRDFSRKQPFAAVVLTIGLGSLAGIPPLAGFIGKVMLFIAAFQAQQYFLLAVAVVGVVISIYYYFGWIREVWFESSGVADDQHPDPAQDSQAGDIPTPGVAHKWVLGALAIATILLGIFQGSLGSSPF